MATNVKRKKKAEVMPDDGNMTLTGHLKELRNRLIVCAVVFVAAVVVTLAYADRLIDLLTAMGQGFYTFVSIAPQEKLMQYFRVSLLAAVVVTVPVALYQMYAFAKPGLKKSETFFLKLVILLGLALFVVGVMFAYKLMMPFMLRFLSTGIEGADYIQTTTSIESYVSLCLTMFIIFGCVFESRVEDTKNNPYIKGVWFEDSYIRKYPFSTLAADVIGFASAANGGELGLENYYDEELSGTDGISYSYVGENLDVETQEKKAEDGYNLVTTIDYKVQSIIENKIKELNAERPSKSTAVIAMNPKTGEILAMASYPTFNLNNPRDLSGVYTQEELSTMTDIEMTNAMYALWSNYCVSTIYEPGSTFKPFTVAEGLEEGVIHDGDTFYCGGFMEVSGSIINCHEHSGHGTVTVKEGLIQSCNPTMMQIAAKLGGVKIAKYAALFGFGNRTGIDLPGEEAGLTIGEKMTVIDAACNSFGQNINVNMVQMAAAFSSLVNGGNYYQPHIVKRIEKSTGEVVKTIEPNLVRQTVTSETSQLLRTYLRAGVDEGLARKSGVAGYAIGGKTGTAQKQPREDKKWVVSYIGCAPTDDPQLVLYTVIDEPFETNGTSGSSLDALNLSRSIYEETLPYLNIYKDIKAEPVDTTNSAVESTVELPDTTNTNNN